MVILWGYAVFNHDQLQGSPPDIQGDYVLLRAGALIVLWGSAAVAGVENFVGVIRTVAHHLRTGLVCLVIRHNCQAEPRFWDAIINDALLDIRLDPLA